MSEKTKIQWCDDTWNPWRGCTKVSPGCAHCYAETLVTTRLGGEWGKGKPRIRAKDFDTPLRWNKKPWVGIEGKAYSEGEKEDHLGGDIFHRRLVFSLSLGDWLDDEVPIEWLADMLDVIRRCPNLEFLLLTKRPENWAARVDYLCGHFNSEKSTQFLAAWLSGNPPSNIWLGVSAEDQKRADERIPLLLHIPAKVRFVSYEPALGPIRFSPAGLGPFGVSWIIVGGESGPQARPFNIEWARSTVAQCKTAGVACFVKQMGSNSFYARDILETRPKSVSHTLHPFDRSKTACYFHWHEKKGGDMTEWPEDLRVREWP